MLNKIVMEGVVNLIPTFGGKSWEIKIEEANQPQKYQIALDHFWVSSHKSNRVVQTKERNPIENGYLWYDSFTLSKYFGF